nr:hypothetical protein [Tanacetum cinerariifolium]
VVKMEGQVLNDLNFQLSAPITFSFLRATIETPKIKVTYKELSVEGKGDAYVGHRVLPYMRILLKMKIGTASRSTRCKQNYTLVSAIWKTFFKENFLGWSAGKKEFTEDEDGHIIGD